jgi:hypothetical protein
MWKVKVLGLLVVFWLSGSSIVFGGGVVSRLDSPAERLLPGWEHSPVSIQDFPVSVIGRDIRSITTDRSNNLAGSYLGLALLFVFFACIILGMLGCFGSVILDPIIKVLDYLDGKDISRRLILDWDETLDRYGKELDMIVEENILESYRDSCAVDLNYVRALSDYHSLLSDYNLAKRMSDEAIELSRPRNFIDKISLRCYQRSINYLIGDKKDDFSAYRSPLITSIRWKLDSVHSIVFVAKATNGREFLSEADLAARKRAEDFANLETPAQKADRLRTEAILRNAGLVEPEAPSTVDLVETSVRRSDSALIETLEDWPQSISPADPFFPDWGSSDTNLDL